MYYTVGDEVRCVFDGRFGIVVDVNEEDREYTVDFDGEEMIVTEDEVC